MSKLNRRNPYSTVRSAAEHYWRIGLEPIPIGSNIGGPSDISDIPRDWSPERMDREFGRSDKVGVVLGSQSGDLVEVQALWQDPGFRAVGLMRNMPAYGREGLGFTNYLARSNLRSSSIQFKVPDDLLPAIGAEQGVVVELRGHGHKALLPPSLDSNGKRTSWRYGYLALKYHDDIPCVSRAWLIARSSLLAVMTVIYKASSRSRASTDDLLREITAMLLQLGCDTEVLDEFFSGMFNASLGWKHQYRRYSARAIQAEIAEIGHVADIVTVCRMLDIEPMVHLLRSWVDPFAELLTREPIRNSAFDQG